ncbi:MAG TPA: glutamate-1-semialdehyde 2,1-aminomutase [Candidatus Binatia bacterium]
MSRSAEIFRRAIRRIPGGVNSPVRAWKSVGGKPLVIARGKGSYIFDIDGRRYIDFVGSWGPLILGHAHPKIVQVVKQQAGKGFTFGAPTEAEAQLAEEVSRHMPSVQMLRLVSSGTEATMSAIRLARAFTGRRKIVKFDGCYHGHVDGLLVKAGSGVATLGLPDCPGVPDSVARETLVAKYNDVASLQRIFEKHGSETAAVIVEPICGNMGVIPARPDFIQALRNVTRQNGALLIFDEVITGFRLALGGAQEIFRVKPDLTCVGKIIGGGFPLAAYGGPRKIMNLLAPSGPVYQAGTLSGNPIAVNAGLATLKVLSRRGTYRELEEKGGYLADGFRAILAKHGIKGTVNHVGSMMTLFFGVENVRDADDARKCDRRQFATFFHGMLSRGVYLPPAPFEAMFVSLAHSRTDLNRTIRAFDDWAATEALT